MGGYESKEFERLRRRGFKDYSLGHRNMYLNAIKAIGTKASVFEAGFGIGWGLRQMDDYGILGRYVGVEPNVESFQYVRDRNDYGDGHSGLGFGAHPNVTLIPLGFDQMVADRILLTQDGVKFDEAFCIEVIEHIPLAQHLQFLIALRQMAPRLWFSSPDSTVSKEGVRTVKEWKALLTQAKFKVINIDVSNWTYLYECK